MSNRVCHACISFLNSWQSFKNRCYAAQKKQQNFLDLLLAKERAKQKTEHDRQRQLQSGKTTSGTASTATVEDQQRILKNALLNSTMRSNAVNNTSIDVVSVLILHFFFFIPNFTFKEISNKNNSHFSEFHQRRTRRYNERH